MFNESIEKISKQIEELEAMQADLEQVATPAQKVLEDIKWIISKLENYPKEKELFYRAVSQALGTNLVSNVRESFTQETSVSNMGNNQETNSTSTTTESRLGENVSLLSELVGTAKEGDEVVLYIGFDKQKIRGGGEPGCSTWKQAILERYDEAKITSGLASENSPIKKKWLTRVAGVTTGVINTLVTWDYSVAPEVFFARVEETESDVQDIQIVDTNGHLQVPEKVIEEMEESNIPEVVEEPTRKLDFTISSNNPRVGRAVIDGSFRLYIGFDSDDVEQDWRRYLIFNNPELCFAHYDGADSPLNTPQILEVTNLRESSLVKLVAYDYSQLPPINSISPAPILKQPEPIDMFDVPVAERQEILEELKTVEVQKNELPAIDSSELLEAVSNTKNTPILDMGDNLEKIQTPVEQVVVHEPMVENTKQQEQFEAVDFNPDEMFQLL